MWIGIEARRPVDYEQSVLFATACPNETLSIPLTIGLSSVGRTEFMKRLLLKVLRGKERGQVPLRHRPRRTFRQCPMLRTTVSDPSLKHSGRLDDSSKKLQKSQGFGARNRGTSASPRSDRRRAPC